jgi:hypothetical protein
MKKYEESKGSTGGGDFRFSFLVSTVTGHRAALL